MTRLSWLLLVCACGATTSNDLSPAAPTETHAEPEHASETEPAPEPEPEEEDASLESLLTRIEPSQAAPPLTLVAAVEGCPPPLGTGRDARIDWFDGCQLQSALAHTTDGSRWVGLGVDYSEGGPEGFVLWERDARGERNVLRGSVEPEDVAALLTRVRGENLTAAENIVTGIATTYFSLNEYSPLVELGEPLEGWRLWIETTANLDQPEYVAWLISAQGERREVARRVAGLGACDGDGYWCEQTDSECDDDGLRAEGRLCVLPLGIGVVAVAGNTLGFLGGVQVAGHGGYPPFHWVMTLPPDL